MTVEIQVPSAGESVNEVRIGEWLKSEGDAVARDESVAVLETDKASMELPAPEDGTLAEIVAKAGTTVTVGEVIGRIETNGTARGTSGNRANRAGSGDAQTAAADEPLEHPEPDEAKRAAGESEQRQEDEDEDEDEEDAGAPAEEPASEPREAPPAEDEEVVPMSLLRQGIARRLVEAQREAALLTTFNEIDLGDWNDVRAEWGEAFEERHGTSLGLMSLFVKAVVEGLKATPELNARVRGTDIVYRRRFHIGIAVGTERGLVVPVLRDADRLSLAGIEEAVADFARRAASDELELDELSGGTFTISNGGVFGSLLSTPIVNPPQTGVLGMHAIQERPVVRGGSVLIRPMMYVALSYDHRIVDGREAVGFLRRVKEIVEAPARLLLEA